MSPELAGILSGLKGVAFHEGRKGLEKESLRVAASGGIAQTPHPQALGSALCHPQITTDYSEALLELVTGTHVNPTDVLAELLNVHQFVYQQLEDEFLWVASMPCVLDGEKSIRIAEYGSSNVGRMKHVYRIGLGYRYGRIMQAIAGIHFNYSPPESLWGALAESLGYSDHQSFRDRQFMGMLRNIKRLNWLVSYLFGSSPAVCKSFLPAGGAGLEAYGRDTWYYPHGTSLRLSDIGYSNRAAGGLRISYNSLGEYVEGLRHAIASPHPAYSRIGTHRDGEWLQLNANVLQIENEYYSFVRPKRVPTGNEKRTSALARDGIQYVELRSLDLDPWAPAGLTDVTMRFLEVFMVGALLSPASQNDDASQAEQDENLQSVARNGRAAGLTLKRDGKSIMLKDWASETLESLTAVARLLDASAGSSAYSAAVDAQRAKVADPDETPSARVVAAMRAEGEGFYHFAMRRSKASAEWFGNQPVDAASSATLKASAEQSLSDQAAIEAADNQSFDKYLAEYFAQP